MSYRSAANDERHPNPRCQACRAKDQKRRNPARHARQPDEDYRWNPERQIWEDTRDYRWNPERQAWDPTFDWHWSKQRQIWEPCYEKACETEEIRAFCHRGDIIILNRTPFYYGKLIKWPWATLALSYLIALFLVRHQDGEWLAYILATLSIVHLYALVFSKGAAIRNVALATMLVVLSWAVWLAFPGSHVTDSELRHWGPIIVWVLCIIHALFLGEKAQPSNRRFCRTFLVTAVFVFGMWGVLAIDLRYDLGYGLLANVILPVAALVPLIVIMVNVLHVERDSRWRDIAAALLLTLSLYLTVLQIVVEELQNAEKRMAARLLSLSEVHLSNPAWFTLLQWKFVLAGIVFLVAVTFRAASIWERASQNLRNPQTEALKLQIADCNARISQDAAEGRQGFLIVEHVRKALLHGIFLVRLCELLVARISRLVFFGLLNDLRRIAKALIPASRRFALPVISFSIAALFLMAVVRAVIGYATGTAHAYAALALWGGFVCTVVIILALCAGSFAGLSPITQQLDSEEERASDTPSALFSGIVTAAFITCLFWVAMTVLEPALWPLGAALTRVGVHRATMGFGTLALINLAVVALSGLVIAVAELSPFGRSSRNHSSKELDDGIAIIVLLCVLAAIGIIAIYLGHGLVIKWFETFT